MYMFPTLTQPCCEVDAATADIEFDLEKFIAEGKDGIATSTDEIAALKDGLRQLDRIDIGASMRHCACMDLTQQFMGTQSAFDGSPNDKGPSDISIGLGFGTDLTQQLKGTQSASDGVLNDNGPSDFSGNGTVMALSMTTASLNDDGLVVFTGSGTVTAASSSPSTRRIVDNSSNIQPQA